MRYGYRRNRYYEMEERKHNPRYEKVIKFDYSIKNKVLEDMFYEEASKLGLDHPWGLRAIEDNSPSPIDLAYWATPEECEALRRKVGLCFVEIEEEDWNTSNGLGLVSGVFY